MTDTVLIANRGEIACRIIRSVQSLGLKAVAVYSDTDAEARHVRLADSAVHIGPSRAADSYLDAGRILAAAKESGAGAIHPGYGFLAENAGFADAVQAAGIAFIGPDPDTIRRMGDKQEARMAAKAAGVPISPGSGKLDLTDDASILQAAEAIGFPVLVKAAGGGGGIGLRPVSDPSKLVKAVQSTSAQGERAFSDGSVYLEKLIQTARHVEVQIFGRGTEAPLHLYHRECSLQRRYQKVIEEALPASIRSDAATAMIAAALNLARAVCYSGAGTIEYLYDEDSGAFYFMEMNTRLQVEHPVTEMVTGQDIVAMQIRHALGHEMTISQDTIEPSGHAIELRICAEIPEKQFIPSPGRIEVMHLPEMPGLRIDTGFEAGDAITPFYDSLVMKMIGYGETRADAIEMLRAAVAQTRIEGIQTNLAFLGRLLAHPDFAADRLHTKFIETHMSDLI